MRKKIFTFLLALTASIGMMWAETVVVINKSEFTSSGVTKEGVTLAKSSGSMTSSDIVAMDGSFEFSTSLGKFTGITIETDANIMQIYEGAYTSAGWPTGQNLGTSAVWTGESETVLISCMVAGMNTIKITCTIEPTAATENSIVINGTPQVGDNSISLTYYFDPANVPGICCYAPTLKVKCVTDNLWDEKWLDLGDISSGTETITLDNLGSFQAGKSYDVCFAYNNGGWVDDVFQSFTPAEPQLAVAYTVALEDGTVNADKVTLSATSAVEGATITVTPNEEYEITAFSAYYVVVEDQLGSIYEIDATLDPGTGAYSFTMPAANVTIEATIAEKAAPQPQPATTVTWNSSNISNLVVNGSSYSQEGVTLGANANNNYAYWLDYGNESQNGIYFYVNATGGFTFSNSLGKNFTKIEMTLNGSTGWYVAYLGSGWNIDGMKVIWTGNASTVDLLTETSSFGGAAGVKSIVFYFEGDSEEPTPQPEGDGKLTGAFTINADGDQIVFSKGNLQYQASTTTWQFATNQYDMIGADNANISDTYTGWIDLFGWGTGNCPTKNSTDDEDYSTFVDWGTNAISNGGNEANLWRTLTRYEWNYLIKTRTNADNLKGQATVADVHGYVLLPDSWTLPAGLSFSASPNNWTTNVYTAEQWAQMEAAGAVFLPATGYRNPDIVYVGEKGWYWSSDVLTANAAYDFEFTETTSRVFGSRHYFGQPVRLVTAYDAPAPQPAENVNITPYVDPDHAGVYYSTFFDSSVKYELPAGVEAYVADLSGANLLLTKIAEAGEVIPANVAVILKSTVTPFTLTVSDADAVTFTATNDLQGSDTQIATPGNCYVLAGNDGVGFYHYTAAMLNPHKAYVIYSGSQAPKRMPFIFDQATGVESVQPSAISSQKVIENGQLFIIKNGVKYNAQGQVVK